MCETNFLRVITELSTLKANMPRNHVVAQGMKEIDELKTDISQFKLILKDL